MEESRQHPLYAMPIDDGNAHGSATVNNQDLVSASSGSVPDAQPKPIQQQTLPTTATGSTSIAPALSSAITSVASSAAATTVDLLAPPTIAAAGGSYRQRDWIFRFRTSGTRSIWLCLCGCGSG